MVCGRSPALAPLALWARHGSSNQTKTMYKLSQNNSKALVINTIATYRTWMKKNVKTRPVLQQHKNVSPPNIHLWVPCSPSSNQVCFTLRKKSRKENRQYISCSGGEMCNDVSGIPMECSRTPTSRPQRANSSLRSMRRLV